jgi:hypothetical protein
MPATEAVWLFAELVRGPDRAFHFEGRLRRSERDATTKRGASSWNNGAVCRKITSAGGRGVLNQREEGRDSSENQAGRSHRDSF